MRTIGVYLIYAAVALRGLVRLKDMQYPGLVVAFLALHGFLLLVETWTIQRQPLRLARGASSGVALRPRSEQALREVEGLPLHQRWLPSVYLLVQSGLVIGLLLNRAVQDVFALLFIPLSLQAVLFFGRRAGFLCITALTLAMTGPLVASQKGWFFGLVMVFNYGGLCFLVGGYAHQIQKAETARSHNQRTLGELQVAHRRLQDYAIQMEDLAAEQERNRLARELHDSVTQTVFSMNLTVQSARLLLERDPCARAGLLTAPAGQLERLEELAASAMREIQALVSQLRPRSVAKEGLPAALRRLAAERLGRDGLDVTVEVNGEQTLLEPLAVGLYYIAQEALTNVVKHAGTRQATVRLNLAGAPRSLEIEDHGLGFDPQVASSQHGHLGLAGMSEQARELDWSLSIESRPSRGTRIRVEENLPGGIG